MTVQQARAALDGQRLRFGDAQQIYLLRILRLAEELREAMEAAGAEKCVLCDGSTMTECETCGGRGCCQRCEYVCEDCDGAGWIQCPLCGGTGRPVVSQNAPLSAIEDGLENIMAI
jgi:DnaJ-class molecular chaperone